MFVRVASSAMLCAFLSSLWGGLATRAVQAAASTTSVAHDTAIESRGPILLAGGDWEQVPASGGNAASGTGAAATDDSSANQGHPQRGPNGAPITIVEFSDFQSQQVRRPGPHCLHGFSIELSSAGDGRRFGSALRGRAGSLLGLSRCAFCKPVGALDASAQSSRRPAQSRHREL